MTAEAISNRSTIYFAPLSKLVPELRERSLSGIVPRYLLKTVPNGKVPLCHGLDDSAAFAIGGIPLRRPEAQFHWIFGENNEATSALCQFLKHGLRSPKLYFHPNVIGTIRKHFPEDKLGTDQIWVSHGPVDVVTSLAQVKTFNAMPSDLKFSNEIASRLPPEEIWEECRFEYIGLEVNGVIEATAEYTVDDGEFCLIQQLFTSSEHRNTGLSKMLLSSLSNAMHKRSITPVMISCSKNESVSSVARASGFKVAEEVGTVEY